jgi:hypothetical protein
MPFYLNPFSSDFTGAWVLSDRKYSIDFKVPRNSGRGDEYVVSYAGPGPFDLNGNDRDGNSKDVLVVVFALNDPKNWTEHSVTISATDLSAVTATEVVSSLNTDPLFSDFFTASLKDDQGNGVFRVVIRQKKPIQQFRFYIKPGRAEETLKFNKFVGVSEIPSFFARHTIANRFTYADSQNMLIELVPGSSDVDADVITNAVDAYGVSKGYDSGTVQADWQLLRGRAGLFNFQKITVDGSDRITQIIEYPAGAVAGDMARLIGYTYTGGNTKPDTITEIPYTLQTGDLVTP